ncbi:MAG TPA: phosphatidylglycerophosphatase A [Bacteroidetes bacterium]|nr:phosphatidylglycerophosphatase A [Bacteroidota bacterium]
MFWKFIATGFGSGYSPIAPGTAGALVACAVLWVFHEYWPQFYGGAESWPELLLLIGGFFFLGVKSAGEVEKEWGHDASKIVVDEMVGLWMAMLFVPFSLLNLGTAFVLFRIFDIWKPLGIRNMEKFNGGWGVMMDDVLAGGYSLVVMHLWLMLKDGVLVQRFIGVAAG